MQWTGASGRALVPMGGRAVSALNADGAWWGGARVPRDTGQTATPLAGRRMGPAGAWRHTGGMALPLSLLTLGAMFALAVWCSAHGGAWPFALALLAALLGTLTLRLTLALRAAIARPSRHTERRPACP